MSWGDKCGDDVEQVKIGSFFKKGRGPKIKRVFCTNAWKICAGKKVDMYDQGEQDIIERGNEKGATKSDQPTAHKPKHKSYTT